MDASFNRRVVIVSGKGGVGKSTIAAALGMLAARRKRVLLVEFSGQCSMAALLGGEVAGYEEVERAPNLFTLSITAEQSMEEYLVREMRSRRLFQMIFKNQYVGPFLAAVPGLEDLMSIGKVMDLERALDKRGKPRWDLILVDAPATGQGLNLLRVPRAMMDMTRMGPFYQNTRLIYDLLIDPKRTLLHLVTLAEEMPVNETIEMHRRVAKDIRVQQGYVFANHLRPQLFNAQEQTVLEAMEKAGPAADAIHPGAIRSVLRAGVDLARRTAIEAAYLQRLRAEISLPLVEVPAVPRRNIGLNEIGQLAEAIQAASARLPVPEGLQ